MHGAAQRVTGAPGEQLHSSPESILRLVLPSQPGFQERSRELAPEKGRSQDLTRLPRIADRRSGSCTEPGPLHLALALVFNLSHTTASRYAAIAQDLLDDVGLRVWPDGTSGGRYRFQHALYQQVLYDQIGTARRRQR